MTKGQRIRKQRELMHYGLTELAEKVGVSKQTLYKYENDIVTNIPSDKLEEIADVLNVTPAYLMGWDIRDFVDEYIKSERDTGVLSDHITIATPIRKNNQTIDKAMELYQQYSKASPEVQAAIELLLKSAQSDS